MADEVATEAAEAAAVVTMLLVEAAAPAALAAEVAVAEVAGLADLFDPQALMPSAIFDQSTSVRVLHPFFQSSISDFQTPLYTRQTCCTSRMSQSAFDSAIGSYLASMSMPNATSSYLIRVKAM